MTERLSEAGQGEYCARPRLNALLAEAAKQPLTIVCAGAGYGKTRAVFDFAREQAIPAAWLRLSARDNAGSRFWGQYIRAIEGWDSVFAGQCKSLGFPDTDDKRNQYLALRRRSAPARQHLFILDDAHLLEDSDVLQFLERRLRENIKNISVILICRELPRINLVSRQMRGLVPRITEDELIFTENELALYLRRQGVPAQRHTLRDILRDTGGWAFAVSFAARSLQKSPGYAGYVRVAMKQNLFRLMETEVFEVISEGLRRFLTRLSLIDHLAADLIEELAGGDEELLGELGRQNAYLRFDGSINAWLIHHLFLDFLRDRQHLLNMEEVKETYRIAARWCARHGFEPDALSYYERVRDYAAIVCVLRGLPVQLSLDMARCAAVLLARVPARLSGEIDGFAVTHVRMMMRLGRWREATALAERYEEQFLRLPPDDPFRNRNLGVIYYCRGNIRALLSTLDDCYDFDVYYAKMRQCLERFPVEPGQYADLPLGMWASLAGDSRQGAPQAYIEAAARSAAHLSRCWGGSMAGVALCRGELHFYQGNAQAAEAFFMDALRQARENGQPESEYKTLFYLLRLAVWQGRHKKAQQAIEDIEAGLEREDYTHRFVNFDAALGWYACALRRPQASPEWLKEQFAPYSHAYFIENLANQIKARYHYQTRNFAPMLAYIEEMKGRESILFGRVELMALEACALYQMKQKDAAFDALRQAYEAAHPNDIIMPFLELGKDMRTLAAAALREPGAGPPAPWLETVRRRAASYAKHQSLIIAQSKKETGQRGGAALSVRESDILKDLYHGLSRSEIAEKKSLSINTVNSAVNSIFDKLDAHSIVDVVRIAAEERLV